MSEELGRRLDSLARIPIKTGVFVALSFAIFLSYYDIASFSYVSPIIKKTWDVSATQIAFAISMNIVGFFIGPILITILADSYGRKNAIMLTVLVLGTGCILEGLSQNMSQLALFKLLAGAGGGASISIVSVYIGEMSPKSKRGRYTSIPILSGVIGLVSSGAIAILLIEQGYIFGLINGWRAILIIPGIAVFLALLFRLYLPESPRWLLSKGKLEKTNSTLESMGIAGVECSVEEGNNHIDNGGILQVFSIYFIGNKQLLLRLILLIGIWSLILIPINTSSLLVLAYVNQGYTISKSIEITTIGVLGFVAGAILSIIVADKFERKYQICVAAFLIGIGFIFRGLLIHDYVGLVIAGFVAFTSSSWITISLLTLYSIAIQT